MAKHCVFRIRRVCEPASPDDGVRFLVDRLWPRGLKEKDLQLDAWLKDVAPRDALRRWFGHDPARWNEFVRRYFAELDVKTSALLHIAEAGRRSTVTLLYGSRDATHNNAIAWAPHLYASMKAKGISDGTPKLFPIGNCPAT